MRAIALLVLFAVMPTAELAEQVGHVVAHLMDAEPAAHSAHHDGDDHGDEHGCTGLVHLCACHHAPVTLGTTVVVTMTMVAPRSLSTDAPTDLVEQSSPEPDHRPPIV